MPTSPARCLSAYCNYRICRLPRPDSLSVLFIFVRLTFAAFLPPSALWRMLLLSKTAYRATFFNMCFAIWPSCACHSDASSLCEAREVSAAGCYKSVLGRLACPPSVQQSEKVSWRSTPVEIGQFLLLALACSRQQRTDRRFFKLVVDVKATRLFYF